MLLKRTGLPEEGELLLCEVSNIHFHSVFVKILEYNIDGMVHISEIAPGRIRNIRDYVKEGKYIVCNVLRVNVEKKHVDLSLRRVNERERVFKNNQIKLEQRSEKIVEQVAKELKLDKKKLYTDVTTELFKDYSWLYDAFLEVSEEKITFDKYKLDKKVLELLTTFVKQQIKPPLARIQMLYDIKTYVPDGVEVVKKAFSDVRKNVKGNFILKYEGGSKYLAEITAENFPICEDVLKQITTILEGYFSNPESLFSFEKKDVKASA
jgi:translation initiation factor 2 subunit 1